MVEDIITAHRRRVEQFIKVNLMLAGFDFPVSVEVVQLRCRLIQGGGKLTLCIDGKEVATMDDIVQ